MAEDDRDLTQSKVAMRGKMLVAWFSDATPPVLWRWVASEVSTGFGLRQANGAVELVRHDGGVTPQIVASFSSVQDAEQAMALLSRGLFSYQVAWKRILGWISALLLLIFLFFASIILYRYVEILTLTSAVRNSPAAAAVRSPGKSANLIPKTSYGSGLLPGQLPPGEAASTPSKPASPPTGAPVDVDSFYH